MPTRPSFSVCEFSDSFHSLWAEMAEELGAVCTTRSPEDPPDPAIVATIVAAGGEEEHALDLLPTIRQPHGVPLYLVGAAESHRFAVEALRRGATDYFALPGDLDLLRRTVAARVAMATERETAQGYRDEAGDPFATLRGGSPALAAVLNDARRVARHDGVTVLIGGETGTGKELLARALHEASPRSDGPFIIVNCAAIPSELIESEFVGHERGAFTGAHATKPGLFEEADRGTLFLDEIGHLPLHLQGKLLRVLEERRVRRVGATQSHAIDVRIIAASHVDLASAVDRGDFRQDLFYRLNVVTLTLPPLRERPDDIHLLAEHFAETLSERYAIEKPAIGDELRDALVEHAWPGNVRELRHAVERALLLSDPGKLDAKHLLPPKPLGAAGGEGIPFPATLEEITVAAVLAMVERHRGNKSAAARALGISRARLQRVLDREERVE